MTFNSKNSLPAPHASPWALDRSKALCDRARQRIPGLTLSMMKRPEHFAPGRFPVYLQDGEGALVTDPDGNEYIDFVCGLGANSLGHRHPAVRAAITETIDRGLLHSLPHELEVTVAEQMVSLIPGAEMVRFFKTGADATSAAVRLARALTGRERVVTIGYNGWHDHFMFDTKGVPAPLATLTSRMPLFTPENEGQLLELLAREGQQFAAVLLSVPYNRVLDKSFLQRLREQCTSQGIQLVFDEIVTGFRLSLGGIQEYFGIAPDYSCYSKAMAAGMPLSAVVGPKKALSHMEELQVSTTFGGEMLSLAAASACMTVYQQTDVVSHLAARGRQLKDGVNRVAEQAGSSLRVVGYDAIPLFLFHPDPAAHGPLMTQFQGLMAERGVLLRRDVNFLCAAHTEGQVAFTIDAAKDALAHLSSSPDA